MQACRWCNVDINLLQRGGIMLCLCLCFVCFCLCLCFVCICLCFVFSCYMCVGYAGRADAVWAGAEWGHYAKCPFSYPPLYPPLSFLDYLQFKLEHSSQIFLDTIKSSQTPPPTHYPWFLYASFTARLPIHYLLLGVGQEGLLGW